MKTSFQTRVSLLITLIILSVSFFGTLLFTTAAHRSKAHELRGRGSALSFALSKAAAEGLLNNDLNLIKKASSIFQGPDVTLTQVYLNNWEAADAFPPERLNNQPHPAALRHFKISSEPFQIEVPGGYDFYRPISFQASEQAAPSSIGFVRLTLSSTAFEHEFRNVVITNFTVSVFMTLFAIVTINLLIRRLLVRPVMTLRDSISQLRDGCLPENLFLTGNSTDEVRALAGEINRVCKRVKENESKLIASDRRIRSLFERVEHAIFRIDQKGRISEANSRFRWMFGGVTELCDIMIGEIDASNCLHRAASDKTLHIEDRAISRHGDEILISLSLYAELNSAGDIVGFDGYIIDITDKKRMEERLMRSQKLEAIGTLAAGMAHDFNNLLTGILGYSGIMLKMTKEDDPYYKPVSVIHDAAKRGAALGKKILSITRKEKLETRSVDINEIIRQSVDLLQASLPRNIEIITRLDASLPRTIADPSQLHQVIINLAMNACDAMPEGGKLTLETAIASPAKGQRGDVPPGEKSFIKLSVSDTGTGIDLETQNKIFDPFFTTKEAGKGTGLGLYVVHSIISNHGGYINLYSEPQQGTRFNIYLPAAKDAVEEALPEPADIRGTETILIIDDEHDVRELCKDMLVPLGYTVLLADSGSAGINLYREKRDEIHLVILDMIMPKMGGNDVFRSLTTINKDVIVLLYSGYNHSNFAGINELLQNGAAGFFQKPFSTQDIGIAIRNALAPQTPL